MHCRMNHPLKGGKSKYIMNTQELSKIEVWKVKWGSPTNEKMVIFKNVFVTYSMVTGDCYDCEIADTHYLVDIKISETHENVTDK